MERIETRTSSMFKEISYQDGYLKLYFINGTVYQYRDVPKQMWDRMKNAASTGSFYNTYIKPTYQFVRLI